MSKEDFRITIADVPRKEDSVCEVYYKESGLAEISYEEKGKFFITFFNKRDSNYWEFPYDEAMEVLEEAKNRLSKYQRTPEEQVEYDTWHKKCKNWEPTSEETAEYERKMEEHRKKYYG